MEKREELQKRIIQEFLEHFDQEDWRIEYQNGDVTVEYLDTYEIETVDLWITWNQYNVPTINLHIEQTSVDEEIPHPSTCHDCWPECQYYSEEECKYPEELEQKEIEQWTQKPSLSIKNLGIQLNFENTIHERICYLNITHYHLYKATALNVEVHTIKDMNTVLNARDLLIAMYQQVNLKRREK